MQIRGEKLQEETVLEIGKFAILWNCFERSWCDNNCTPQKINSMSQQIHIDVERQTHFAEVLNTRRHWFGQLEMDYVRDSLHPGNAHASTETDMETMRQFLAQRGDNLIVGCLLVIHRLRNNLIHGIKLLKELDGQIELFRAANDVLESIW